MDEEKQVKKQLLKNIFQVTFFSTLATIAIFYILFNSGIILLIVSSKLLFNN